MTTHKSSSQTCVSPEGPAKQITENQKQQNGARAHPQIRLAKGHSGLSTASLKNMPTNLNQRSSKYEGSASLYVYPGIDVPNCTKTRAPTYGSLSVLSDQLVQKPPWTESSPNISTVSKKRELSRRKRSLLRCGCETARVAGAQREKKSTSSEVGFVGAREDETATRNPLSGC